MIREDDEVGESVNQSRIVFAFLCGWSVALLGGLLLARLLPGEFWRSAGTVGRLGSSCILVALAWWQWRMVQTRWKSYGLLIFQGILLGTVGDFSNAQLFAWNPLGSPTLGAIVAFGLGHICYILAILGLLRRTRPLRFFPFVFATVWWQAFAAIAWFWIVFKSPKSEGLLWPALGYCILLAGTTSAATVLAWHRVFLLPLAGGSALFLISDLILAVGLFQGSFPFQSEAVWLTYGPGQMLIVLSIVLVERKWPSD